jgi:hypothetical protein
MKPTKDAALILSEDVVARVVELIRRDPVLGRGTFSSWEEVAPTDYEAAERVRALVEDGVARVERPTPSAILGALRAAEREFWSTAENN